MLVTVCKSGEVVDGQLVPSAKQTLLEPMVVLAGKRAIEVTVKSVPVAAPQNSSDVVTDVNVNKPVNLPSPSTSSVCDGVVVPIPTK